MTGARVAAALCLMASMATPSLAQEAAEDWQFQAVVYLWLPAIGGETAFPGDGGGEGPGIDVAKILENLNLVFMGSLGMEKGRWGVFTDVVYLDIGDSDSPARSFTIGEGLPVNASASVRYDLNGWLTTVAGTWSLVSAPEPKGSSAARAAVSTPNSRPPAITGAAITLVLTSAASLAIRRHLAAQCLRGSVASMS